ncbi:UDP-2,3-diacylglucosamine diphosphatase [Rubinisphaera brasiliensis]|uniref:Metallophosphoesterase n=1 Tax=Rubinisphaera brasiliensis (strain ATCC 49424 / DSM 5305 / JCM 21570 / IAM 15109 / NBRC 103401 / IFAM 1448) TaxID=756272 RepID=F0SQI0_RUBBR|nr:UDP-2,3-diacylglucosamine diphosphatase [Rubinisphaera brasiliensis]ADY57955.1 metallophosphoesterase [Rubinisphaera brasiliensis DSM 5305]
MPQPNLPCQTKSQMECSPQSAAAQQIDASSPPTAHTLCDHPNVKSNASPQRIPVRALFVSDVHLGSPHCCAEEFLGLLERYQPERLYLVGDIVDGRRLRQAWRWPEVYNRILARISTILSEGARVFYTPGNHDEFFREILPHLPPLFRTDRLSIADEFLYESQQGARLLVTHGDQFDRHEKAAGWVSRTVTITYDWLLKLDNLQTRWKPRRDRRKTARQAKGRIARLEQFVHEYEGIAAKYAERGGYDGVICGHVHQPKIVTRDSISYCNTGDWIEHCTALIEHRSGEWELTYFNPEHFSPEFIQQSSLADRASLTWWTKPPGQNVKATLLKSNQWSHRHSFPAALSGEPKSGVQRTSGNSSHAAAEQTERSEYC